MNEGEREGEGKRDMEEVERERRCRKKKAFDYSQGSLGFSLSRKRNQPPTSTNPLLQPLHQTITFPSEKSSVARLYHPPQGPPSERGSQPCPGSLTLHVEGHAVGEAVQLVIHHAHELLPVSLPARHQPVPADNCDGAIAIPDLLKLCLSFELGVPGDSAGGLPIRGGAGGYQDLFCPARLSNKWPLGALHPIGGLSCKKCKKEKKRVQREG